MNAEKKAALLARIEEANEVGGVDMTTLGSAFAIEHGADDIDMLLHCSITDLCRALSLRGYDVKARQPDAKALTARLRKWVRRFNRTAASPEAK